MTYILHLPASFVISSLCHAYVHDVTDNCDLNFVFVIIFFHFIMSTATPSAIKLQINNYIKRGKHIHTSFYGTVNLFLNIGAIFVAASDGRSHGSFLF